AVFVLDGQISGWLCNLYSGGGIVADSIEEDEWNETNAKTEVLATVLSGRDGSSAVEGMMLNSCSIEMLDAPMAF
ncbi:MAG: chorismate-binding protein, partial [Duncaniella sp.]|nr:chorismate-binding protein [Duncaniella sp.]